MKNYEDLIKKTEAIIGEKFKSIPQTKLILKKADISTLGPDLLLYLKRPEGSKTLIFEIKNNGQPREARITIHQIQSQLKNFPNAYGVMVAPFVSDQAAEICREAGIGYMDLAGNCRLAFDNIFIESKGASNSFTKRRDLRSLYSPKASRVLRVLLNKPSRVWKMQELGRESLVSLGQIAKVKNLLDVHEWIKISGEGLQLTQPLELLKEWTANYSYFEDNSIERFYTLKSNDEMMKAMAVYFKGVGIPGFENRFALTGFAGSDLVFPFVRGGQFSAYVENVDFWVEHLELKRVDSGENVSLAIPYDEGVFYGMERHQGVPVVSPIQLYLDLETAGGRGQDAAERILKEVILKKW
jgi:hypothetical protein